MYFLIVFIFQFFLDNIQTGEVNVDFEYNFPIMVKVSKLDSIDEHDTKFLTFDPSNNLIVFDDTYYNHN